MRATDRFDLMTLREAIIELRSRGTRSDDQLARWLTRLVAFEEAFEEAEIIWGKHIRGGTRG